MPRHTLMAARPGTIQEFAYIARSLGAEALAGCTSLSGVLHLPASVTLVGANALYGIDLTKYAGKHLYDTSGNQITTDEDFAAGYVRVDPPVGFGYVFMDA